MKLYIKVVGTPAPQGSKRHVGRGVMVESSAKVKPWRQDVRASAIEAMFAARTLSAFLRPFPLAGPVAIDVTFWLRRPKSHYRTGKHSHLLREPSHPAPVTTPDLDKLVRSTCDGLGEAGVWHDDAQMVTLLARKLYCVDHAPPGAEIWVSDEGAS